MFINNPKKILVEIFLRLAIASVRRSGCFDEGLYLRANRDVAASGHGPIRHYLLFAAAENRSLVPETSGKNQPNSIIDQIESLFFVKVFRLASGFAISMYDSQLREDIKTIRESGLFDTRFYLEQNRDVLESGFDPIVHYAEFGYKEGRNPNPDFDTVAYSIRNGIPSYSDTNAFVHYIKSRGATSESQRAELSPVRLDHSIPFDEKYYLKKYPDLADAKIDAFEHFLARGAFEGRDSDPSVGGYSQWRKSFVIQPQIFERAESFKDVIPGITVCLILDNQSEDQIDRTLESLALQEPGFDLVIFAKKREADLALDKIKRNAKFRRANPTLARKFSDIYQTSVIERRFVCFLKVGDQFLPDAIARLRLAMAVNPMVRFHYSDEEIIDLKTMSIKPVFKGGFDPDFQLERDYVGNFVAVSSDLLEVAGLEKLSSWAADRFLMVNQIFAHLERDEVNHIPYILYRRNVAEGWQYDAASLISSLEKISGKSIEPVSRPKNGDGIVFRTRHHFSNKDDRASIIIPTRNGLEFLEPCIESVLNKTKHRNFEVIIVDNGSDQAETLAFLRSLEKDYAQIKVVRHDKPFNYSELNNLGAKSSSGDFLVFLNNDIEMISEDWLGELVSLASGPEIGAVGPLLLYPDGTIQHAGVILGVGGVAAHAFRGWHPDSDEFRHYKNLRRVSAVTGACLAIRRSVFNSVGGFDEVNLPVDFNDVDLCLRLRQSGLNVLFTPHVSLYHHESKSRESHMANSVEAERFAREVQWMQLRWFDTLTRDPYYSRNYSLGLPGFKLAWPPREPLSDLPKTEAPSLGRYLTHSNLDRAAEVVKSMGRKPNTLSTTIYPTQNRARGLSVIILNLDKPEFIVPLVESMADAHQHFLSNGIGFEVLIGDTGSSDKQVLEMYESSPAFVNVLHGLKYQFSRCNNQVFAELSKFDTVLFLNNDIAFEGSTGSTLFELRRYLEVNPGVGTVGAQLLFPDRRIQHAGIGVFETGPMRGFVYHPDARRAEYPAEQFPRKMWAVTGACLMMRASDFESVDGFDEGYRTECQDAALCLELRRRGKESVVLSPEVIFHFENGTREKGSEDWPDRQRFMRHWGSWIDMELREMAR